MRLAVGTAQGLKGLPDSEPLDGRDITALAARDGDLWALVDEEAVWHFDGTWREIAKLPGAAGTCLLALGDKVLCGTREARLLRIAGGEAAWIEGFDTVDGRDKWFTPWGGPPDTRSVAQSPDGTIYVNVHVGGILRSADGCETWEPTGLDIGMDVHQVVVHPTQPRVILAATAYGLGVSRDAGETWTLFDEGLHAGYARAIAVNGTHVLLTVSTGPGGAKAAVYKKRLDDEDPFERVAGLPTFGGNVDSYWLDARGDRAALVGPNGDLYVSEDFGTTWTQASSALGEPRCVAVLD